MRLLIGKKQKGNSLPSHFNAPSNDYPDAIYDCPTSIANGFNTFFNTIGPKLAAKIDHTILPPNNHRKYLGNKPFHKFKMFPVNPFQVLDTVKKLKNKSSCGDDYLSNSLLKKAIPYLLAPLTSLINISIETGFVPDQIKVAKVIPLHKSGCTMEFNNYRPIAIISTIGKVLEKIVLSKLTNYLDEHSILHPHQFGFIAHHSTVHPLLLFTNKILHSVNNNLVNLTVYLDLKKAFDTVNFSILLDKLKFYGIDDLELLWFQNYLSRSQFCMAGSSSRSDLLKMILGIPQGTCLGPILFLIFINDLPNATAFFSLLFADDTTLQLEAETVEQLFSKATIELARAEHWFASNKLTLNVDKTKFMIFSNCTSTTTYPDLKLGLETISRVGNGLQEKAVKFLGIWVDELLTFKHHLSKIKVKLSLALYQINQCRHNTPLKVRLGIYHSLFESHLRFGSAIYGSASENDLDELFIMQKMVIRSISNAHFRAHSDPLFQKLKVLKLKDLLILERITLVHKFKHNYLPKAFPPNFLVQANADSLGRRTDPNDFIHPYQLTKLTVRHPTNLLISSWNSLSPELKTVGELKLFKQQFIDSKLASYISDCTKINCFSCTFSTQIRLSA